jgi:HAD superfamily hydrolase (TIGR01509 family)
MFEAVIFDFDGTLADTKKNIVRSFQKVLSEIGCVVDGYSIERRIGVGARPILRAALEDNKIPYTEELVEKLIAKYSSVRIELSSEVELFDGAVELLDALYGRTRIALASMSERKVIDFLLKDRGLTKYFEVVLSANEAVKMKPDPEIFLKCAKKLGVDPKQCAVIEDSVFGVEAAKRAGMKCVAIPSGSYTAEELGKKGPDLLVNSLSEEEKILGFLL